MAQIVYKHNIINGNKRKSSEVNDNFSTVLEQINGNLDENNFDSSSDLTVTKVTLTHTLTTNLIEATNNITIKSDNLVVKNSTYNNVFSVDENGTTISGFYQNMPVGTILPYSGTWIDNTTIPGWYKCDGNNGTPNLIDKFVRGNTSSGTTGGSNDAVVVEHTHNVTVSQNEPHTHTVLASSMTNETNYEGHFHSINSYSSWDSGASGSGLISGKMNITATKYTSYATSDHTHYITSIDVYGINDDHTHTGTINSSGEDGTNKNMPAYYRVIFIMRIS